MRHPEKWIYINLSVKWIVSKFSVGTGTKISDFGCGPGLYAARLAEYNADVTGIDFSLRSINYARDFAAGKKLHIQYVNQNYLEFETDERFNLIIMIMCDFCALSPAQRKQLLRKFHTLLEPGGYILLDVYSLNAFAQRTEVAIYETNLLNSFWSQNKYYGFLNTYKYEKEKVVLDKYTIIEPGRTRTVYNWLQYFSPEELEKEFAGNGLEIIEFYSDVAGAPFDNTSGEFAVVVKKRI